MNCFKYYRKKLGITQKEVGERLGLSGQAYSNYENGRRQADYNTLKKLATLYNTSIDNLLLSSEPPRFEYICSKYIRLAQGAQELNLTEKEIDDILAYYKQKKN